MSTARLLPHRLSSVHISWRPPTLLRRLFWAIQTTVAAVLLVLVGALLAGAAPTLVGYEAFVVLSGSMEPALRVGDLAVVAPARPEQLRVRDIISYRTPARPNVVVTHRLVGVSRTDSGRLMFETRGDANDSVDEVEVDGEAVLGRVVYAIPDAGYLVDFAKRPLGKALLIGLPALLLVADALMRRRAPHAPEPDPVSPADALVSRAWVAQRNGRRDEALTLIEQATTADPSYVPAWLLKAECFDDPGRRLTCIWEGLSVNPGSPELRTASDEAARALREQATPPTVHPLQTYGHASE